MPTNTVATSTYTLEDAENDIAELRGLVDQLNESHTLMNATGDTPETTSATQLYQGSGGQAAMVNASGFQANVVGAQTAFTPGNTTTGAALTNMAQFGIPANEITVNSVYEVDAWGYGNTGTTTVNTLAFQAVFAGNNMSSFTLGNSMYSANTIFRWHVCSRVICITAGSGGTFKSMVFGEVSNFGHNILLSTGTQWSIGATSSESTGTASANTTVSNNLGLSAQWGGTDAGGTQSLTCNAAFGKRWT